MKIRFGECLLDTGSRVLERCGQRGHLTSKAFQLLAFLFDGRRRAVSRAELQDQLWPSTFISEINIALGRIDLAFEWMETALCEKSGWLVYLKTDRRLAPVRDDPRYERLLLALDLGSGQSLISP